MLLSSIILAAGFFTSQSALSDSLHLSISEENFGFGASFDPLSDNTSSDISWLHDDDYDLLRAGFYVDAIASQSEISSVANLNIDLGLKGVLLESDFDDGMALALGGKLELPIDKVISLFADVYYASGKLSFSDVEKYTEWSLGVKAKVIKNGELSLAYSSIEVDTDSYKDVELEDGVVFKIAFGF